MAYFSSHSAKVFEQNWDYELSKYGAPPSSCFLLLRLFSKLKDRHNGLVKRCLIVVQSLSRAFHESPEIVQFLETKALTR